MDDENFLKSILKKAYIQLRDWTEDSDTGKPKRIVSNGHSARFYSLLAKVSASQQGWTGAVWAINLALVFDQNNYRLYLARAKYEQELKRYSAAIDSMEDALRLRPEDHSIELKIASTLCAQRKWGDALKVLEALSDVYSENANYLYMLANSYQEIGEQDKAKDYYKAALKRFSPLAFSKRSLAYYRLGRVYTFYKNTEKASKCYRQAVSSSRDKNVKRYGIGQIHEDNGYIADALDAYNVEYQAKPDSHMLLYKIAEMNRRKLKLNEALRFCKKALKMQPNNALYRYEMGRIFEVMEQYEQALAEYTKAQKSKLVGPDAQYRLGIVYLKMGNIDAFDKALTESGFFFDLRKEARSIKETSFTTSTRYTEYYELLPIDENVIVYESMLGKTLACNPHAIFRSVLKDKAYSDFTHVWVIDSMSRVPREYKKLPNVIFVRRSSDLYMRHLASAKYLINNSTFPTYFIRKEGQQYLNTWHGTPWKTLGRDIKYSIFEHANTARNLLQATHIISPNSHTTEVLTKSNDIEGLYTADVMEIGYPRIDATLNLDDKSKTRLYEQLGPEVKGKKIVLYAPTWRGVLGNERFDIGRLRSDVARLVQDNEDSLILFRGHHYVEKILSKVKLKNLTVVPGSIDTNDLLNIVDVLITDYSSVAFDFMPTKKPILFYIYDYDFYREHRGLYFDVSELPGESYSDIKSLSRAIRNTHSAADEKYKAAVERFCPHEDGKATDRAIKWFFKGKVPNKPIIEKSTKPTAILFGGGYRANGISLSFLNLLNRVDEAKCNYATIVVPHELRDDPEKYERFLKQPDHIKKLGLVGGMDLTPKEREILMDFELSYGFDSAEARDAYNTAYRREFKRVFGRASFQAAVDYEGYRLYWASLFGVADAKVRSIHIHNDLYSEWLNRFPKLGATFQQFHNYDKLVGVSQATCKTNLDKLAEPFKITRKKFDYCDNIQNSQYTIERAKEPLDGDIKEIIESANGNAFVAVGRLSPEKDHYKLIEGFSSLVKDVPEAQLVICGDGPLRGVLEKQVKQYKLGKNVHLLGFTKNPYPIIKASNCFVLSSNYEGQPVVFYEAFALGKPVIATDIDANVDVLKDGYGLLVENSAKGLYEGMREFTSGRMETKSFDIKRHEEQSLAMFYKKVLGLK